MRLQTTGGFRVFAAVVTILLGVSVSSASAEEETLIKRSKAPEAVGTHELALIGEWGTGAYEDIHVEGNYAFCAALRAGLDVVDISDPSDLQIVANAPTEYDAMGVYVSASHAFVATYRDNVGSRLEVYDVSDPLAPSLVGTLEPPTGYAYPGVIFVVGDHAYLGYSSGGPVADLGMDILDVSDPTEPSLAAGFRGVSGVNDIFVLDDLAYLAASGNGLWIVNVSAPQSPFPVGVFNAAQAQGVYVVGNYAFLAASTAGLIVVNVSDPTLPIEAGRADPGGWQSEISVSGGYAYLDGGALHVVDVSSPTAPLLVGSYTAGIYGHLEIFVVGTTAYLAETVYASFQIVDASDPSAPARVGGFQISEVAYEAAVSGGYAYIGTKHGLAIVDLSDPYEPSLVAFYPSGGGGEAEDGDVGEWHNAEPGSDSSPEFVFPEDVQAVEVEGQYAYLDSSSPQGIHILDITDPSNPVLQGTYDDRPAADNMDLFLQGSYLYATQGNRGGGSPDGLLILDVSNPLFPWLAGSYGSGHDGWNVDVQGENAYVTLPTLKVLDVDPPWDVTEVSSPGGNGPTFLESSYVYQCKSSGSREFRILDVSDPFAPGVVGSFPLDCTGDSPVSVSNGYAYLYAEWLDPHYALYVFDVSDPTAPVPVGTYPQKGWGGQVTTDGDYVYLADGITGKLLIYRIVSADLAVTKTDSQDPIPPGGNLSYTLTVSNSGWTEATDVVLTDTLPDDVSFLSSVPGAPTCTETAGVVTCNLGSLAFEASSEVIVHTRVSTSASGTLSNTATAFATQLDWSPANNSAAELTTVGPPICDLAVRKIDSADPVDPGDPFTYTVSVGNYGPSLAGSVTLTDPLPEDVVFVSVDPGAPTCTESGGTVTCNLGPLDARSAKDVTIDVVTNADFMGSVTNIASVTGPDLDPVQSNNEAIEATQSMVVFADGFESGDVSAWSDSTVCPGCPVADFSFFTNGLTVDFLNQSSGDPPLSYHWDFGDGTQPPNRFDENPVHTYSTPGIYNVTLTVSNSMGTDSIMKPVTVSQ